GAIPDLARVRAFLRRWCDAEVALDRLEVSHLSVGPDGPRRALYEGPGPGGQVLRLIARRMEAGEGRRLEAELNHLRPAAPAVAGFVRPAIYAPELHLLFQVFPADRRLAALARAVDGGAMAPVLEAAPAARTGHGGVAANVAKVTDRATEFATLFPGERQRIAAIRGDLRARLGAMRPSRLRLTHGDFQGDNILIDGARIGLVDLEDCAMGDPADDVGSNWAQLTWHTLEAGTRTPIPNLGRQAFLAAYLGRTDAETA